MNAPAPQPRAPIYGGRQRSIAYGQQVHAIGALGDDQLGTWPDAGAWIVHGFEWGTRPKISERDDQCGLHRISTSVQGAILESDAVAPLGIPALVSPTPLGAGNQRIVTAPIWAALDVCTSAGTRRYLVDWGQTLEVNCDAVQVAWAAPADWVDLERDPFPAVAGESAVILELAMFCDIARCEVPGAIGVPLHLTQTYVVEADATRAVAVPRGAYALQITRDNVGATLTTWCRQAIGDPAAGASRLNASIRIENGQSVLTAIGPGVTHVQFPTLAGELALWTLAWLITI